MNKESFFFILQKNIPNKDNYISSLNLFHSFLILHVFQELQYPLIYFKKSIEIFLKKWSELHWVATRTIGNLSVCFALVTAVKKVGSKSNEVWELTLNTKIKPCDLENHFLKKLKIQHLIIKIIFKKNLSTSCRKEA